MVSVPRIGAVRVLAPLSVLASFRTATARAARIPMSGDLGEAGEAGEVCVALSHVAACARAAGIPAAAALARAA
eukprot:13273307-Alexandrium_andersonii.AAC.1